MLILEISGLEVWSFFTSYEFVWFCFLHRTGSMVYDAVVMRMANYRGLWNPYVLKMIPQHYHNNYHNNDNSYHNDATTTTITTTTGVWILLYGTVTIRLGTTTVNYELRTPWRGKQRAAIPYELWAWPPLPLGYSVRTKTLSGNSKVLKK